MEIVEVYTMLAHNGEEMGAIYGWRARDIAPIRLLVEVDFFKPIK